jgi:hypothetical protein
MREGDRTGLHNTTGVEFPNKRWEGGASKGGYRLRILWNYLHRMR